MNTDQIRSELEFCLICVHRCLSVANCLFRPTGSAPNSNRGHFAATIILSALLPAPSKRHNVTMSTRLLPLFPLQVVVFPRTPLPLHIFEDRYKEMVGAAMRDSSEFGVVLAKEDGIVNAGCTVIVEKVI